MSLHFIAHHAAGRALALAEFATPAHHADRHPLNLQRAWRELEGAMFK